MSVSDWMSVLKLSTMWCLDKLRARAIEGADAGVKAMPDVVERILLARQYNVSRWLIDGYETLGKRPNYLSTLEQSKLGLKTAVKISELRERSWTWYTARLQSADTNTVSITPHLVHRNPYSQSQTRRRVSRDDFDYISSIRVIFMSELSLDKDYLAEQYTAFDSSRE